MSPNHKRVTIAGLGIAAIGALFAGVQTLPVITGSDNNAPAATQTFQQMDGTTNCANVQGGTGAIDCRTVYEAPEQKPIQLLEATLDRGLEREFVDLIGANHEKIVKIKIMIAREFSSSFEPDRLAIFVPAHSYDAGVDPSDTSGSEFLFNTAEGGNIHSCLGVYYCVDGYFSVQPVMGMMMGGVVGTGLVGMSDTQARLADPGAR